MTLLLVFVGCLFTIFALWLAIAPFLGGTDRGVKLELLDEEVREIELLVAQRQVLLTALRELDFDRETDKIAAEDYERFRHRYEAKAVSIMRRLDEIHGGRGWQKRVDEELTELLGHAPTVGRHTEDDDVAGSEPQSEPEHEPAQDERAAEVPAAPEEPAATEEPEPEGESSDAADDDVDDEVVAPLGIDSGALVCAGCGEDLEPDDKFCSQCGAAVALADEKAEVSA